MSVYQITFKSGAQQFMEMDMDDAIRLSEYLTEHHHWLLCGAQTTMAATGGVEPVFSTDTGATLIVSEVAGFQHYISPGHAERVANEDGGTADFNDAMDATIKVMMSTAEVEGNEPNGYVAAVDQGKVKAAFLTALGHEWANALLMGN